MPMLVVHYPSIPKVFPVGKIDCLSDWWKVCMLYINNLCHLVVKFLYSYQLVHVLGVLHLCELLSRWYDRTSLHTLESKICASCSSCGYDKLPANEPFGYRFRSIFPYSSLIMRTFLPVMKFFSNAYARGIYHSLERSYLNSSVAFLASWRFSFVFLTSIKKSWSSFKC